MNPADQNPWRFKRLVAAIALLGVVVVGFVGFVGYWSNTPLSITADQRLELTRGQPFSKFARSLAEAGIITQPRLWGWQARWLGKAHRIQAGEYWIRPGDTPNTLLEALVAGEVIRYEIQLLEGWTLHEVLDVLARNEQLTAELSMVDKHTLLGVLGLPGGNAEGLFFPDTYQFTRGASDADILRRAYEQMQLTLAAEWQDRAEDLPYDNPYQALVVASLIEKETGRDEDRSHIGQVFATRLRLGMRLQTDPSVIYGLGRQFDGNLTRKHLLTDTPYNTYTRNGLPPTPIALASARSIEAALQPANGDYLYFVSRGDGSSQFSISLEEHQTAVRKYQLQ